MCQTYAQLPKLASNRFIEEWHIASGHTRGPKLTSDSLTSGLDQVPNTLVVYKMKSKLFIEQQHIRSDTYSVT